jgi:hypothetical protein
MLCGGLCDVYNSLASAAGGRPALEALGKARGGAALLLSSQLGKG